MTSTRNCVVVKMPGPHIQNGDCETVRQMLFEHIEREEIELVLDFSEVEFAGTSLLVVLVGAYKALTLKGGQMKFCCVRKPVRLVLELMRLHRVFDIYESLDSAVGSFE